MIENRNFGFPCNISKQTTTYVVDNEKDASDLVELLKKEANNNGTKIINSKITYKTKKSKGEVVEDWYVVECCESADLD